jgi:hypothetical protein
MTLCSTFLVGLTVVEFVNCNTIEDDVRNLCTIAIIPMALTLLKQIFATNFSKDKVKATVTKYIVIPN